MGWAPPPWEHGSSFPGEARAPAPAAPMSSKPSSREEPLFCPQITAITQIVRKEPRVESSTRCQQLTSTLRRTPDNMHSHINLSVCHVLPGFRRNDQFSTQSAVAP